MTVGSPTAIAGARSANHRETRSGVDPDHDLLVPANSVSEREPLVVGQPDRMMAVHGRDLVLGARSRVGLNVHVWLGFSVHSVYGQPLPIGGELGIERSRRLYITKRDRLFV